MHNIQLFQRLLKRSNSKLLAVVKSNAYGHGMEKVAPIAQTAGVRWFGVANVEEAIGGQSRKDFVSKLSIAYKEARETNYWLKILKDTGYLQKEEAFQLLSECEEILKIIGSIQNTIRNS